MLSKLSVDDNPNLKEAEKQMLKNLEANGDSEIIEKWCTELEVPSVARLTTLE